MGGGGRRRGGEVKPESETTEESSAVPDAGSSWQGRSSESAKAFVMSRTGAKNIESSTSPGEWESRGYAPQPIRQRPLRRQ